MPWFGFFRKIAKADLWIVLDHSENNPRDAAFWGRRVKILVNGAEHWLSIPLSRPEWPGVIGLPIKEMTINVRETKIMQKCLKTIHMAYSKARYFAEYAPLADRYFADPDPNLMRRNIGFIKSVLQILHINTDIIYSSDLTITTKSTQMLVDLLKAVGSDIYLCGLGAQGYQQDDLFGQNGITLEYNYFQHPVYRQMKTKKFITGLSILDLLFHNGAEQVASWIKQS
jgi:hypothetical protein